MTRYRIVCADGGECEHHTMEYDSRTWAEDEAGQFDALFGCAPHRVEEVPDGDA